jgi:hypothetical protein
VKIKIKKRNKKTPSLCWACFESWLIFISQLSVDGWCRFGFFFGVVLLVLPLAF